MRKVWQFNRGQWIEAPGYDVEEEFQEAEHVHGLPDRDTMVWRREADGAYLLYIYPRDAVICPDLPSYLMFRQAFAELFIEDADPEQVEDMEEEMEEAMKEQGH